MRWCAIASLHSVDFKRIMLFSKSEIYKPYFLILDVAKNVL
jgi:hypothetical protein